MSKIGFWTWLSQRVGGFAKELFCVGLWVLIPMLFQVYIMFFILNLPEAYSPTLLLWFVPAGITAAYQWYKEFEEDC